MRKLTLLITMLFLSLGMAWAQPVASPAPTGGEWAEGTTWYQIKTGHGNYLRSDVLQDGNKLALTNSTATLEDVALWCFVGDPQKGYTFYNRATGPNKPLAMYGTEANAYAVLAESPTGTTAFDFTRSKKSGDTWWCLKEHGTPSNYWNKRGNRLAYWNSTQAVNGWGDSGAGDDGSALLFTEVNVQELECKFTDTQTGNVFTGIINKWIGENPTFTGVTLSNITKSGNQCTADITFPFPVSKEGGVINMTTIASFNSDKYWHAIGDDIKVQTSGYDGSNAWLWAIYPKFENGKFTYTIKNVGNGKYVYSAAQNNSSVMNKQGTVSLNETASKFVFADNDFRFDGMDKLYLSINSSGDTDVYLGVHTTTHGGTDCHFSKVKTISPVAKIGEKAYYTLSDAVAAAQPGAEIVVVADIADVTVDVTKNLTISGAATLNNVGINANGADALTVKGLTFTGNSWINSGTAEALTVSGITATVAPSNTSYTNSRSAFISLGRSEGQELALTVENSNITVKAAGADAILGWAKITKATITGNVIKGSSDGYFTNADAIKFMSIADGAEFVVNNNEIYSNYNGIVFAQNTTRDNAYSVSADANKFYGGADHIWIEVSGANTVHATVNATSANTVNGNAFTVGDIKYHSGVIKTWSSYAGVDVVTDANGKVIGGTLASFSNAESVAEGYEIGTNGVVGKASVAEVNGVKYTTFAAAAEAVQTGGEIKLIANIDGDIEVPTGVTLNGNGFAVNGVVTALGEITFAGVTKATNFGVANTSTVVNIPAGASLQLTGTGRMVIGHGCTFNITGAIADNAAKTADKATLVPSLVMPGASFTGAGVTFNVTNAYISAPSSYCSSSKSASGTFDFNINNSIWENAGKLAFESQSTAATVNFDLVSSVLNTGSHLVFGVSRGEVVIDDSNVNVGKSNQIENQSTMTIKNGSVVNGSVATSSNAKNPGTIIVENATYAVTGEFSGSDLDTGTLIIKKGATVSAGSITKANITIDATDMAAGDVVNLTANLANLAGTLSVSNNDKLEAKIVDGKIVLVAKPVAKIGEQGYATLEAAFAAATDGQTITLVDDATPVLTSQRAITKAAVIDLDGKTLTLTEDDLYFGTTTFKNGTIVVDPSVKPSTAVFWMFADQTLTFDAVKIVATGVTGTYLIGLDGNNSDLNIINGSEILVENTTALDLDIICVNASTGNDIKVENSKVNVKNLDGRVFFRGNYTVKDSEVNLAGITKAGFCIEAGQTLSIEGTSMVNIEGEPRDGGIHLTDATATYTKAETATVEATVNKAPFKASTKAELNAALAAAQEGDVITLTADIDYGTDQLAIAKAITLDLGGKVLTTRNAYGGMSIKNNPTVKNGTIVHASNTATIKVWNATAFEDLVIDVQGKGDANKTIGGIVLQSGSTTKVGSIKNVTIKGAALTNGIETYNCGDATEYVIGAMENVTIDAQGTGLLISAPCGTATNCDIKGGTNGIEIWIKGNYSASLDLVNSKVEGGVYAHDEFSSNPDIVNNGTLKFTADEQTTGAKAEDVTLTLVRAEENVQGVLKEIVDNAQAKVNDTYHATLTGAIAAAKAGDVVTVFEGTTYAMPSVKAGITIVGEGNVMFEGTLSGTLENLTLKNLHIKGGNAQRWAYAKGNLMFENVTFEATSVYALHFDGIAAGTNLTYKDCTIIGWAAMGGSPASCVFDGCTIKGNGTYGVIRTYFDATINNCTFDVANVNTTDAYEDGIHAVGGVEVTVTNCTNKNGAMEDLVNVHGASVVTVDGVAYKNVAKVGDKYYATFAEAYTAAQAGETVTMLADLNMSEILVINKAITLDGNGKKLTSTAARAINVDCEGEVGIKNLTINASGERAINVIKKPANVTIENVTATAANYTVNVASSAPKAVVTIKGSNLTGLNVVNVASPEANVTIEGGKITCNDQTDAENYAALALHKDGKKATIAAIGVDFVIKGDSKKAKNGAEGGEITIDGKTDEVAVNVAYIKSESDYYYAYTSIEAAIEAAKAGETIVLIRDITASDIITINKAITLDGNGKKLTSTAGRAINVSGAEANGVKIQNLTIEAKGERAINVIQNATNVTIENVTATAANYTVNVASSAPKAVVTIKGSNLTGLNVVNVASPEANVTIEGGKITCNDQTDAENYAALALHKDGKKATIAATGVDFVIKGDSKKAKNGAEGGVITIDGKIDEVAVNVAYIDNGGDYYYAYTSIEAAIAKAKEGETITLIRDVTMDYNARDTYATQAQNVVINGNGKTLTLNQKNSDWASFGLANNSKLVLNNMNIEKTGYGDTSGAWNTHAIIFSCPVEMNNVTVNNSVAVQAGATLNNVTINEAGEYYGLWINGNGQTVTLNGGAIKATNAGRGIKIADQYIDAPAQVILNVTGTKFTTAKKAAVLVTSTAGANITATNVDITEVEADNQNMVWVDEDRAANYGAVTVTGAAVAQEKVESFPIIVKNGDKVVSYFKNLDELFDNVSAYAKVSNVTVELTGDVVATKVVKTNSLKTYNFVTKVAEGVTMDMQYADDWNYFRKVNIGENVTVKCKYMVFSTETTIAGTVDAYYPYINGGKVTVAETGTLKYEGGDALQVKGKGAVLTVNGTVNAPTINVWGGNAQLVVSGANAKVESNWIDIWDGTPSVAINNGATIKTKKIKVSRGGEITITDANLLATESIEVGHNGNSAGKLTETGNSTITGEIKMTATGSTVASDGGLNVTTQIEGYTVVFDTANKLYKVVAIGDVAAKIGNSYYETLAAAITAAQANDVITFVNDITEDVTISKSITIDGAGKKYTGNIQVKGGSAVATIKNVNFVNGSGYAVTTNTINNITIENCTVTGYKYGFLYANKSTATITVKDVTIDGGSYGMNWNYGTTATLENVVMTNVTYGIHTRNYGAKTFTINNCNIDATTPIYIDEKGTTRQTFAFEGVNNLGKTLAELSLSQYAVIKGANVGKFYGTLQSMVAKAENGQTVKLLSDITMKTSDELASCDGYPSFIHLEGKAVTVDLNGKAITATASAEELAGKMLVGVFSTDKGGEFTLADSSAEGTGSVTLQANDAKVYSLLCNYNPGCKITVNGGTYTADMVSDCLIFSGAQVDDLVTINGGNFTLGNVGTGENGKPWIFNVLGSGDNHVLVKGGTFNADINRQHWSNEVVVPETHYTVANADGTYTVKEGAVAYVNEGMLTGPYFIRKNIGYATLAEAVAAVDTDETVTMLKDVTLEETLTITADKKNITLDLNGKTVSQTKAQTAGYQMILNDGELTIDDSSEAKTGKISYTDSGNGGEYISDVIYNRATLVINGGTIENLSSATVASNGYPHAVDTYSGIKNTSVTINGGTISCAEYSAIRMFCVSATNTADLVINGGNVKGAIDMQNGTKVAALGYLSITGGKFETTKNANNIRFANWNGGATEYGITASITGGDFYGGITTQYVPEAANWNNGIISGGTFASDMTKYCATDFRCVAISDDRYIVERFGFHFVDGEFDEYVNDKDVEGATITYKRTLNNLEYNAFYLPFEVPLTQEFLNSYDVAYVNDLRTYSNANGEITGWAVEIITIKDVDAVLHANHPYMIKAKNEDAKNFKVTVSDAILKKAKEVEYTCSSMYMNYVFRGNTKLYEDAELSDLGDNGAYGVRSGEWYPSSSMKPFRVMMYMVARDGSPVKVAPDASKSIRFIVRGEEGTTDIEGVEFNTNGEELIFDLQGRRVLEPKKGGIYIINGKKVYYNK